MAVNAPPSVSVQNVLRTFGSGLKLEKRTNTTMTHRTLGVRTYSVINHKMSRFTYKKSLINLQVLTITPSLRLSRSIIVLAGTQAIIIPYRTVLVRFVSLSCEFGRAKIPMASLIC